MPIAINGSGTITGLSAGGLPDGSITTDDIAANAVTPAKLSTGAPSWTSGGDLSFNSGYGSVATAYGCRAWVNFAGATPSIRSSGNVSSVTKNAAGDFTINFTNAMPDANYTTAFGGGSQTSGTSYIAMEQHDNQVRTTSAVRIYALNGAFTPFDAGTVCVHIFR